MLEKDARVVAKFQKSRFPIAFYVLSFREQAAFCREWTYNYAVSCFALASSPWKIIHALPFLFGSLFRLNCSAARIHKLPRLGKGTRKEAGVCFRFHAAHHAGAKDMHLWSQLPLFHAPDIGGDGKRGSDPRA